MDYEWDEAKNQANIAKHGISFEQAKAILDHRVLNVASARGEEQRIKTIGLFRGQVIVVIRVERRGKMRIISARVATKKERNAYQAEIHTPYDR